MNQAGKDFIKEMHKKLKTSFPISESQIQERIMRLGIEAKIYQLEGIDDFEQMARATIIEDRLNKEIN